MSEVFEIQVYWSAERNVWCAQNADHPLIAEDSSLDVLVKKVKDYAIESAKALGYTEGTLIAKVQHHFGIVICVLS